MEKIIIGLDSMKFVRNSDILASIFTVSSGLHLDLCR